MIEIDKIGDLRPGMLLFNPHSNYYELIIAVSEYFPVHYIALLRGNRIRRFSVVLKTNRPWRVLVSNVENLDT